MIFSTFSELNPKDKSTMTRKHIIVGIGEILWDVFERDRQLGGAPANFAYHCKMLGAASYIISCIGDDEPGKKIIDTLKNKGLSSDYIAISPEYPTGMVTVAVDDKGKPDYVIHENAAWDHIPLTDAMVLLAGQADAVCFGSLAQRTERSREMIRQFLSTVRPDCIKMFDINLRQHYYSRATIKQSLEIANVLKLNDEELPVIAGMFDINGRQSEVPFAMLKTFDLNLIVLTMGRNGSRLISRSEDSFFEGIRVKQIADTVGAGDSFTAAVAVGLLRGEKLDTINRQANQLAAYVCSQPGAMPERFDGQLS